MTAPLPTREDLHRRTDTGATVEPPSIQYHPAECWELCAEYDCPYIHWDSWEFNGTHYRIFADAAKAESEYAQQLRRDQLMESGVSPYIAADVARREECVRDRDAALAKLFSIGGL